MILLFCAPNDCSIARLVCCGDSEEKNREVMKLLSIQIPERHQQHLGVYMLSCTTHWCTKKTLAKKIQFHLNQRTLLDRC